MVRTRVTSNGQPADVFGESLRLRGGGPKTFIRQTDLDRSSKGKGRSQKADFSTTSIRGRLASLSASSGQTGTRKRKRRDKPRNQSAASRTTRSNNSARSFKDRPIDSLANQDFRHDPAGPGYPNKAQSLHEVFKESRTVDQEVAIGKNLMDDPSLQKDLSQAVRFEGTCHDMCPQRERLTRIAQNGVDPCEQKLEEVMGAETHTVPLESLMVKRFERSSAGKEKPLPQEVRTIRTLTKTTVYLLDDLMRKRGLVKTYGFLWDRTRAVRSDFLVQVLEERSTKDIKEAVYCFERIARFHIVATFRMARTAPVNRSDNYSQRQNSEQLANTLASLRELYGCLAYRGEESKARERFLELYTLCFPHEHQSNGDFEAALSRENVNSSSPSYLHHLREACQDLFSGGRSLQHAPVLIQSVNLRRVADLISSSTVPIIAAMMVESRFNIIRASALSQLYGSMGLNRNTKNKLTPEYLQNYLCFDARSDLDAFLENLEPRMAWDSDQKGDFLRIEYGSTQIKCLPTTPLPHLSRLSERTLGLSDSDLMGNLEPQLSKLIPYKDSRSIPPSTLLQSRVKESPAAITFSTVKTTAASRPVASPLGVTPSVPHPSSPLKTPLGRSIFSEPAPQPVAPRSLFSQPAVTSSAPPKSLFSKPRDPDSTSPVFAFGQPTLHTPKTPSFTPDQSIGDTSMSTSLGLKQPAAPSFAFGQSILSPPTTNPSLPKSVFAQSAVPQIAPSLFTFGQPTTHTPTASSSAFNQSIAPSTLSTTPAVNLVPPQVDPAPKFQPPLPASTPAAQLFPSPPPSAPSPASSLPSPPTSPSQALPSPITVKPPTTEIPTPAVTPSLPPQKLDSPVVTSQPVVEEVAVPSPKEEALARQARFKYSKWILEQWMPVPVQPGSEAYQDINERIDVASIFLPQIQKEAGNQNSNPLTWSLLADCDSNNKACFWLSNILGLRDHKQRIEVNVMKSKGNAEFMLYRELSEAALDLVSYQGAILFACNTNFNLSDEARFEMDRRRLQAIVNFTLQRTKMKSIALMVVCFGRVGRTGAQTVASMRERNYQRELSKIYDILDLDTLPTNVIGRRVYLIERKRDVYNFETELRELAQFVPQTLTNTKYNSAGNPATLKALNPPIGDPQDPLSGINGVSTVKEPSKASSPEGDSIASSTKRRLFQLQLGSDPSVDGSSVSSTKRRRPRTSSSASRRLLQKSIWGHHTAAVDKTVSSYWRNKAARDSDDD